MLRIVKISFFELGECLSAKGVLCDSTVREGKVRKEKTYISLEVQSALYRAVSYAY